MLYLIGLGLSENSVSREGIEAIKKCKKVYLENYTVGFPYALGELEKSLGLKKKILPADRDFVESLRIVDESDNEAVALLIYGSPLTATTHISITEECKKRNVEYRIIYNASVIDAVASTGLQLYKFGKITSMPKWDPGKSFTPDSFMEIVKENAKSGAHSLILIDIGLEFSKAIEELKKSAKKHQFRTGNLVACSRLGTKEEKILYGKSESFLDVGEIKEPFCLIIPGKMHFFEEESLKGYSM